MAKKKTEKKEVETKQHQWTTRDPYKEEPDQPQQAAPADLEVPQGDRQALIDKLLKVEGMNQEMAEHMAAHGVPGDSYVVQTFYRVSATTADAVIKVFAKWPGEAKEVMK